MPRERIVAEAIRVGTGSDQAALSQRKHHFIEGDSWRGLRGLVDSKSTNSIFPVRSNTHFSSAKYLFGSRSCNTYSVCNPLLLIVVRVFQARYDVGVKRVPSSTNSSTLYNSVPFSRHKDDS